MIASSAQLRAQLVLHGLTPPATVSHAQMCLTAQTEAVVQSHAQSRTVESLVNGISKLVLADALSAQPHAQQAPLGLIKDATAFHAQTWPPALTEAAPTVWNRNALHIRFGTQKPVPAETKLAQRRANWDLLGATMHGTVFHASTKNAPKIAAVMSKSSFQDAPTTRSGIHLLASASATSALSSAQLALSGAMTRATASHAPIQLA